jgi:hypothetical protein
MPMTAHTIEPIRRRAPPSAPKNRSGQRELRQEQHPDDVEQPPRVDAEPDSRAAPLAHVADLELLDGNPWRYASAGRNRYMSP